MIATSDPTERTNYSDDSVLQSLLKYDGPVMFYTDYVLWDCSTEYMINNGMPTNADVKEWIKVLESRTDANASNIQAAIRMCKDYIKEL